MSNLYKNIECLCAQNNLNITQLCREINVSRSTLSELSAGRTKDLSSEVKRKIAQYFLVNIEFLDQENYDIPLSAP
jgi:transcriptional regulator with XRE-family HTH domain